MIILLFVYPLLTRFLIIGFYFILFLGTIYANSESQLDLDIVKQCDPQNNPYYGMRVIDYSSPNIPQAPYVYKYAPWEEPWTKAELKKMGYYQFSLNGPGYGIYNLKDDPFPWFDDKGRERLFGFSIGVFLFSIWNILTHPFYLPPNNG